MFWILLWVVAALVVLICIDRGLRNEDFEKIPGPPGVLLFNNTLEVLVDPVKLFYYFKRLSNRYRQLCKIKVGPKNIVLVGNPEDAEVLISGTKHISKGFLYGFMEPWLREGLLLSDGTKWHHRRKILTPTFHFNILRHFHTVLEENSCKLVENLKPELDKPRTDISSFVTEFSLHSICETAMGTKLDEGSTEMGRKYKNAIFEMGEYVVYRAQRVWLYSKLFFSFTPTGRKQQKLLDLMSSFRTNVVEKRRNLNEYKNIFDEVTNNTEDDIDATPGKKKLAMLDLLIQLEKEGKIDAQGIAEEVDTFMFEGHDTTATALQMIFLLLANNEKEQNKAFEEFREIFGSSDRSASTSDLSKMKYLECCIKEGLRLYPPVHFISRVISEPMKLKDYVVPAGTDCSILIYDMHRRSDQFSSPLQFIPERFLGEPTWHPYAYIPFSAGPRNCIGQKFAMMEMKLAVSSVLRRFKLLPVTRIEDVVFITDFILRPNHPIYVKFEKRE